MRLSVLFFLNLFAVFTVALAQYHDVSGYVGNMPVIPALTAESRDAEGLTERKASWPVYRGISVRDSSENEYEEAEGTKKTYLLLGDGESLNYRKHRSFIVDERQYHFEMEWGNSGKRFSSRSEPEWDFYDDYPPKAYRPIWKISDQVLICRFEFPLIRLHIPADKETATPVDYPEPLLMNSMTLDVAINGKSDGFTVHVSHDGTNWFSPEEKSFSDFFPCKTLYFRFAAENIEHIKMSADARLVFVKQPDDGDPRRFYGVKWRGVEQATREKAGKTVFAGSYNRGTDTDIQLLESFIDESNVLCMIWKNGRQDAFKPLFYLGHITAGRCADGGFGAPPMPPKSVCAIDAPKLETPGSHTLTIGVLDTGTRAGLQCSLYVDADKPPEPPAMLGVFSYDPGKHFTDGRVFNDTFTENGFTWPKATPKPVFPPIAPGTVYYQPYHSAPVIPFAEPIRAMPMPRPAYQSD